MGVASQPAAPAVDDAKAAGLVWCCDDRPGIRRVERRGNFAYVGPDGRAVRDAATLKRIRALAVPPAWTEVWIAPRPNAHIQATGRDARRRKQYRYHSEFRAARDTQKFDRLAAFGTALPRIRRAALRDLKARGLPFRKVVAAVVLLLDETLIRVGNDEYARTNDSFGLTTLKDGHVSVGAAAVRFEFRAKSGKLWRLRFSDRRIARIVKACRDLPGQRLFQYVGDDGEIRAIGSGDVNAWLREATGEDVTAKDFRTFAGTVLAATALAAYPLAEAKTTARANIREAVELVARRLGNTPSVCRKCYIHPAVLDAYAEGRLALAAAGSPRGLAPEERAVLGFLKAGRRRRRA